MGRALPLKAQISLDSNGNCSSSLVVSPSDREDSLGIVLEYLHTAPNSAVVTRYNWT